MLQLKTIGFLLEKCSQLPATTSRAETGRDAAAFGRFTPDHRRGWSGADGQDRPPDGDDSRAWRLLTGLSGAQTGYRGLDRLGRERQECGIVRCLGGLGQPRIEQPQRALVQDPLDNRRLGPGPAFFQQKRLAPGKSGVECRVDPGPAGDGLQRGMERVLPPGPK